MMTQNSHPFGVGDPYLIGDVDSYPIDFLIG
jgi:hypothetical protein